MSEQRAAEIAAIVLAAGASSRFGSDKLLHPLNLHGVTMPLAAHSLRPWLEAFGLISVVVRPESDAFCAAIEAALGDGIHWVICADASKGMAASLACGVSANYDAAGWLIGLADMPVLPLAAIVGVRDALLAGAALAAPVFDGRRGHPVGFAGEYREELLALQGDAGARYLLQRESSKLMQVEMNHPGILADIDLPLDLQRFNMGTAMQYG